MTKVNKVKTIQVRLTESDYAYLQKASYAMGTNPSALVRQLIQMSINAVKASEKAIIDNSSDVKKIDVPIEENEVIVNEDV